MWPVMVNSLPTTGSTCLKNGKQHNTKQLQSMTSTPGPRSERLLFDPMQAILQRPDQDLGAFIAGDFRLFDERDRRDQRFDRAPVIA